MPWYFQEGNSVRWFSDGYVARQEERLRDIERSLSPRALEIAKIIRDDYERHSSFNVKYSKT